MGAVVVLFKDKELVLRRSGYGYELRRSILDKGLVSVCSVCYMGILLTVGMDYLHMNGIVLRHK